VTASNRHYLARLFEPASIVVIGASERPGTVGTVLLSNLIAARFPGKIHAVNPKYTKVQGVACYSGVAQLPAPVDLAIIATPAATVPGLIEDCGRRGIRAAVVLSAGFAEIGAEGAALEARVVAAARAARVRVLGPNCVGVMRPAAGLNATFSHGAAISGSLALVSQSGAVCTAFVDWAQPQGVGFSSIISLGASADIDFGEILDYLVEDERTQHILMYVEGIHDARRFVSGLRAAARAKPVIVIKAGRHPIGVRAAVSHTGAIVGADDVFDAAIRRAGAVRVRTLGQLVAAASALSSNVRPRGNRLAVITNGGGPGVLAADRAADLDVELATLSEPTAAALQKALPANWSHGNPVDLIGDAGAVRYVAALEACFADEGVDGVLALLTPQAMTEPTATARAVIECARRSDKPLIACWMGGAVVAEGRKLLRTAGVPSFSTPETAVDMFAHVSAWYRNQQTLLQVPGPLSDEPAPDLAAARALVDAALAQGRTLLTTTESRALLGCFRIAVATAMPAASATAAATVAARLGFPVAMKIDSPDITHKSDVGGVQLSLATAAAVRSAYAAMTARVHRERPHARVNGVTLERMHGGGGARELMVGVMRDAVFGPVIVVGSGGIAVEVHADRAVELPPLNRQLAAAMIDRTRIAKTLGAFRGLPPVARTALESVLLRVSEMACELPAIRELDINPLLADSYGAVAVDARVLLQAPARPAIAADRYSHVAIHPYPSDLASAWQAPDGSRVVLRPIRPEDAQREQEFVSGLSPQSRYLRFMQAIRELTPAMLARFTQIDYGRDLALVAVLSEGGRERQIAVARYAADPDGVSCEFGIAVADDWAGRGLGTHLLRRLAALARERGLASMYGVILPRNVSMLALARRLGFRVERSPEDSALELVTLDLRASDPAAG
jgi:acetyltransferase